jgi:hypothetical protein
MADQPGANKEPQPWHAADEKKSGRKGAPIGTHSLTGGGAQVGMPEKPAERGTAGEAEKTAEPDPLLEPRAGVAEILGRKP